MGKNPHSRAAHTRKSDNSAVSEALGTILVFGIVVSGIAIIVLFGTNILNSTKETNNIQNIEQGFKVVQSGIGRVALEKTPVTTARMHVEGGTLYTALEGSTISVKYPGTSTVFYPETKTGELTYVTNGKRVSVQNGGLWMSYGSLNDDIMVLSPRIYGAEDTSTLIINVIRITGDTSSFGGSGTANIIMEYKDTKVTNATSSPSDAVITIDTEYPNAWGRCLYDRFTEDGFSVENPDVSIPNRVVVTVHDVKKVIVSEHTIGVKPMLYTS